MKKFVFIIGVIALSASCSQKTTPTVTEVEPAVFPNENIASGNDLFLSRCTKCHKAKTITKYNRGQWDVILPKMAKKAKLDNTQQESVNAFINWKLGN